MQSKSMLRTLFDIDAPLLIAALIGAAPLACQSVEVASGNIVYHPARGAARELTHLGLDTMPALAPSGSRVVFVRRTIHDTVQTSLGWAERNEIWIVDVNGSAIARRLPLGRSGATPETTLAALSDPSFGVDNRVVYFLSSGWVTSDALHRIDLASGREKYICAANGFEVLRAGRYRGDLMVWQHRYRESGSYDGTWIVSPAGRSIRLVTLEDAPDADAKLAAARAGKLP